jgi:hypothetical protein
MRQFAIALAGAAYALAAAPAPAQDIDPGRARAAVEQALSPIQHGLKTFFESRPTPPPEILATLAEPFRKIGCISCHHEGLGLSTLSLLRGEGVRRRQRPGGPAGAQPPARLRRARPALPPGTHR